MLHGTSERWFVWGIVNEPERPPEESQADKYTKFIARRDRTLAIIDPSLLYLLSNPHNLVTV